jgi:thiosulfate dehydrogenase
MIRIHWYFLIIILSCTACIQQNPTEDTTSINSIPTQKVSALDTLPDTFEGNMIRYGKELLVNFPEYLGPEGSIGQYSGNYLSCQNCHLEAGTRPYGLNFLSSHARYPQYRAREGKILNLADRINNCVVRPLNGKPLPLDSKEINAMLMYMKWLSAGVPTGTHVEGDQLKDLPMLERAADPTKGQLIYKKHCQRCHGNEGEGVLDSTGKKYIYPALWGLNSYQPGSSMHRLLKHAAFVYANMPFDLAKPNKPILTIEEAYDVAAFVNDDRIHPRPTPNTVGDFPHLHTKSIDYPFGPYEDPFSESQHKFGPYQEIIEWQKKNRK